MKIILKEDLHNLGFKGEVVDVKPGYARNFLIPQGKAIIASESALKVLAENERQQAKKLAEIKSQAEKVAAKLEGLNLELIVKTSNQGRIYGSVSAALVADKLEELGHTDINRKMLQIPGGIKEVGEYVAKVRLHKDVTVEIPFTVKSEEPVVVPTPEVEEEVAPEDEKAEEIEVLEEDLDEVK